MSESFRDLLACPSCKGALLTADGEGGELVCPRCAVAYEVRNDIAVLIRRFARELSDEEARRYREREAQAPSDVQ